MLTPAWTPLISVVIPAHRAHATLAGTLRALQCQTQPPHETIVVDSSPEEWGEDLVAASLGAIVKRLPQRAAPQAARNHGAAFATGDVLAFTDADCRPDADWLERISAVLGAGHAIVGGAVESEGSGRRERAMHAAKFGPWMAGGPAGSREVLVTANLAFAQRAWEAVGPFRVEGYSGDTELCWRAREAGFTLHFEPAAVVRHVHPQGVAQFLAERAERGAAYAALRAEHERWSRRRRALMLAASPLIPFAIAGDRLACAARAGRLGDALATLPLQLLAYAAWVAGEARSHARGITSSGDRAPAPGPR